MTSIEIHMNVGKKQLKRMFRYFYMFKNSFDVKFLMLWHCYKNLRIVIILFIIIIIHKFSFGKNRNFGIVLRKHFNQKSIDHLGQFFSSFFNWKQSILLNFELLINFSLYSFLFIITFSRVIAQKKKISQNTIRKLL